MSGTKTNWSIWRVPAGPEYAPQKLRIFRGPEADTLQQYARLREEDPTGTISGLVVTDQNGDPVYACS